MRARIRLRQDSDIDACVRLLERIHRCDAYPAHWPTDAARWLSPKGMLAAWVAEQDGQIVGHIGLRSGSVENHATVWSAAVGVPREKLAAITRLFVSHDNRGLGLGEALLHNACDDASARGLRPALTVVQTHRAAIRLYERRRWTCISTEPWSEADESKNLLHYVSPSR